VPLSPSSIMWYQPMGGDAAWKLANSASYPQWDEK